MSQIDADWASAIAQNNNSPCGAVLAGVQFQRDSVQCSLLWICRCRSRIQSFKSLTSFTEISRCPFCVVLRLPIIRHSVILDNHPVVFPPFPISTSWKVSCQLSPWPSHHRVNAIIIELVLVILNYRWVSITQTRIKIIEAPVSNFFRSSNMKSKKKLSIPNVFLFS